MTVELEELDSPMQVVKIVDVDPLTTIARSDAMEEGISGNTRTLC
jgi:hypothetical protein